MPKSPSESEPHVVDPTHFMSLAGAIQYLTFTRPDIDIPNRSDQVSHRSWSQIHIAIIQYVSNHICYLATPLVLSLFR
jgi:hypothetical protein